MQRPRKPVPLAVDFDAATSLALPLDFNRINRSTSALRLRPANPSVQATSKPQ